MSEPSDARREAAAKSLHRNEDLHTPWDEEAPELQEAFRENARLALDAADAVSEPTDDERLLWQAREALRLTREYVWPAVRLHAIQGWSWWDATVAIDARLGRPPTVDEMSAPLRPTTAAVSEPTPRLVNAAFAIAHVNGCDEPNSNARLCDIADIAEHYPPEWDACECVNMARAAFAAAGEPLTPPRDATAEVIEIWGKATDWWAAELKSTRERVAALEGALRALVAAEQDLQFDRRWTSPKMTAALSLAIALLAESTPKPEARSG